MHDKISASRTYISGALRPSPDTGRGNVRVRRYSSTLTTISPTVFSRSARKLCRSDRDSSRPSLWTWRHDEESGLQADDSTDCLAQEVKLAEHGPTIKDRLPMRLSA
jgi:hypothetical protein